MDRPRRAEAEDVLGERRHEALDAGGTGRVARQAVEFAEHDRGAGVAEAQLGGHRACQLRVHRRRDRRRPGFAALALRGQEGGVVGLVPWAPPAQRDPLGGAQRGERGDQRAVVAEGPRGERAGGAGGAYQLTAGGRGGRPGRDPEHVEQHFGARFTGGPAGAALRGDRFELSLQSRIWSARPDRAGAAADGRGQVRRVLGPRLQGGPVDQQPHVGGPQRGELAARPHEGLAVAGPAGLPGGVARQQQLRVVLGDAEGRARSGGRPRAGHGSGDAAGAAAGGPAAGAGQAHEHGRQRRAGADQPPARSRARGPRPAAPVRSRRPAPPRPRGRRIRSHRRPPRSGSRP